MKLKIMFFKWVLISSYQCRPSFGGHFHLDLQILLRNLAWMSYGSFRQGSSCGVAGLPQYLLHLWSELYLGSLGTSFRRRGAIAGSASRKLVFPSSWRHRRFRIWILLRGHGVYRASMEWVFHPSQSASSWDYKLACQHRHLRLSQN